MLLWVKLYFRFLDLLEGLFVILKLELIGIGILNFCAKVLVYLIDGILGTILKIKTHLETNAFQTIFKWIGIIFWSLRIFFSNCRWNFAQLFNARTCVSVFLFELRCSNIRTSQPTHAKFSKLCHYIHSFVSKFIFLFSFLAVCQGIKVQIALRECSLRVCILSL